MAVLFSMEKGRIGVMTRKRKGWRDVAMLCSLMLLVACTPKKSATPDTGYVSFNEYQTASRQLLIQHRRFQTSDHATEIERNLPREWRPVGKAKGGILLVHGLGDSPWSFTDIGPMLATQGYVVRTILLAGHGTAPKDLMGVDLRDWEQEVQRQTEMLHKEFSTVFLGGFSTGANLVTVYALTHNDISGLLLFSPAYQAKSDLVWLTPIIRPFRPWLRPPNASRPQQTTVRYLNTPTNGFALFYRSSRNVKSHLSTYNKPVLIVTVAHDSVLNTQQTLTLFERYFTHPASKLIWYGELPADVTAPARIAVKPDWLPQQRISQFSHMGILFSPDNPLYGSQAKEKFCWNGQNDVAFDGCMRGESVWYSDWGYRQPGKIYARLTFNPYWSWQNEAIGNFLRDATFKP